ncbi:MAG: hypothetical protein AB7W47_04140 [Calditrichaceae bacterium]
MNTRTDIDLLIAGVVLTIIYIRLENPAFVIGVHALISQPFNMIEPLFPCIYVKRNLGQSYVNTG